MVAKFYPYGALMINRCSRILIVCHLHCFRKHIKSSDDTHGECCESCSFCHFNILFKNVTRFFFSYSMIGLPLKDVVLPKQNLSYYRSPGPYLPMTVTSLQRPLSSVSKVPIVERFDCTLFALIEL